MNTTMKTMRSVLLAHLAAIAVAAASGCSAGGATPAGDESPSVGTAASADGDGDRYVQAQDMASYDMSFQAICDNPDGRRVYSQPSDNIPSGQSATLDLQGQGFVTGANCWVRAFSDDWTHDSGDNFTYDENGGTAVYQITEGALYPDWNLISQ